MLEEFKTLPINRLNGTIVSALVEKVRNVYSEVEEKFNMFVEELKQEHEEAHHFALERLDKVWKKVCHCEARPIPQLEEIVKDECEVYVTALYEKNTE